MPDLTVNNGAGTPSTSIVDLTVNNGAGTPDVSVQAIWAINWFESSPGVWDYEWIKLRDFDAPADNVPGYNAEKTAQLDPPQAKGTWTAISDVNDLRYGYSVEVQFWNFDESELIDTWTGAQSLGQTSVIDYPGIMDPNYTSTAVLKFRYTNSVGSGPQSTDSVAF